MSMKISNPSTFLIFCFSLLLLGAGCQDIPTDLTQITPEHVENAKQYVEEKERILDDTTNKVNEIGKEVEETKVQVQKDSELIQQQQAENEALQQKLAEQEEQRELDLYCDELSKVGSKYLPTKQPLKELYEGLQRQNSEAYFEEEYTSYKNDFEGSHEVNYSNLEQEYSVLAEEFEAQIDQAYEHYVKEFEQKQGTLQVSGCTGCYDKVHSPNSEETPNMLSRNEYGVWYRENERNLMTFEEFKEQNNYSNDRMMTREEFRAQWLEGKEKRDGYLVKLKPHYDEYMDKCVE